MESTSADLGSFEGRYPKDLFKKNVVAAGGQAVGYVAKETDNTIVVFSDSGDLRYDIPKSKIEVAGSSVVVSEPLDQYAADRDAPMPPDRALRPSAEEIIQKAGEVPEEPPSVPSEAGYSSSPSIVEEKAAEVAEGFKGAGRELEQAAKTTGEKMADAGAVAASDMETAARQGARRAGELARSGARSVTEKIAVAQSNTEAGLSADNALKIEKESKQPTTGLDLGSYEGKYPKDLFNKTVLVNDQPIGRVAKETEDAIVVFSDADSTIRFDIPKGEIRLAGNSVVASEDLLFRYRTHRDAPMPPDRALRPSGEEIRAAAAEQQLETQEKKHTTTPDAVMQEGSNLASAPRPETTRVAVPEGYVDTESELSKRLKGALAELKEVIVAGGKVAKKKAKEARAQAEEKQVEMDAESISRMGDLATRFADSFEDVISEIRTRTYADQVQIYDGFVKLIDQQRNLVLAQRDLALRLRDSVPLPVVDNKMGLEAPPELPEDIDGSKTPGERRTTITSSASSSSSLSSSSPPRSRRTTTSSSSGSRTARKRKRT
ncbi:MAG TPA: hypothetical protein VF172_07230 [Nitrososphaera sp.]